MNLIQINSNNHKTYYFVTKNVFRHDLHLNKYNSTQKNILWDKDFSTLLFGSTTFVKVGEKRYD